MDPRASMVDLDGTLVVDEDLVKILSWYDNEWACTAQMMRQVKRMAAR
jgi:glyceraldehyde 3-phosphate dehydrogenase